MITKRVVKPKKVPPLTKSRVTQSSTSEVYEPTNVLSNHQLRKQELSMKYGIRETDIFVDPKNGVELYRTVAGGWVTNPKYRGVE
jgi:hypothetical protein